MEEMYDDNVTVFHTERLVSVVARENTAQIDVNDVPPLLFTHLVDRQMPDNAGRVTIVSILLHIWL